MKQSQLVAIIKRLEAMQAGRRWRGTVTPLRKKW